MTYVRILTTCVECREDYTHLTVDTVRITIMPDEHSYLTWTCPACVAPQQTLRPLPLNKIIDLLNLGVRVVDVSNVEPETHNDCGPITLGDYADGWIELAQDDLIAAVVTGWAHEQAGQ